jgi:hypothetical protein
MLPTFSDGSGGTQRRYRRSLGFVLVLLISAGFLITAINVLQGPQLRLTSADSAGLVTRSQVSVTLQSDRALEAVTSDQVTVAPSAPFTVTTDGLVIRLRFTLPLKANTTYDVFVTGVAAKNLGTTSTWSTSFTTDPLDFLFLEARDQTTALVQASPHNSSPITLYEAPGITAFSRVASVIAIMREHGSDASLEILDPASGGVERLSFPPGIELVDVAPVSWGASAIVVVNSVGDDDVPVFGAVAMVDLLGERTPSLITALDGTPVSVRKVVVSDGGGYIILWLNNGELMRYDPPSDTIFPVGFASEVWGFDSLGELLVFVDAQGTLALNLRSGEITRVPAGRIDGFQVAHELTTFAPDFSSFQRVGVNSSDSENLNYLVTRSDTQGFHSLITGSLATRQSIGAIALSPNGQYLLVETNEQTTPVGYAGLTLTQVSQSTVIQVIDTESSQILFEFPGFSFNW